MSYRPTVQKEPGSFSGLKGTDLDLIIARVFDATMQDIASLGFCYLIYGQLLKCSVGFSPRKMRINFCGWKKKQKKRKKNRQKTTQDRELLLEKNFLVGTKPVSTSSCHLLQGYQTQESSEVFHSGVLLHWQGTLWNMRKKELWAMQWGQTLSIRQTVAMPRTNSFVSFSNWLQEARY